MPSVRRKNRPALITALVTVSLLLSSEPLKSITGTGTDPNVNASELKERMINLDFRNKVVQYATTMVGTRYHFGGCSPKSGFDCSGFTSFVLSKFDVTLPRTSGNQSSLGKAISFKDAQPGDLLFFGRGKNVEHVAIVVMNKDKELHMVHSSSSHGVMIEDMRLSDYWKKRIMFAVDLASLTSERS